MSSGRRDVLNVDDDDDLRATLALLLEFEGFAVRCARDGAEALRAITEARPLIVLLDLMMPVMNGWQFRAAMLADPSLADIPVIVITAAGAARGVQKSATSPLGAPAASAAGFCARGGRAFGKAAVEAAAGSDGDGWRGGAWTCGGAGAIRA